MCFVGDESRNVLAGGEYAGVTLTVSAEQVDTCIQFCEVASGVVSRHQDRHLD